VVLERLSADEQRELGEINAALGRIDGGTYGVCEGCGGIGAPVDTAEGCVERGHLWRLRRLWRRGWPTTSAGTSRSTNVHRLLGEGRTGRVKEQSRPPRSASSTPSDYRE